MFLKRASDGQYDFRANFTPLDLASDGLYRSSVKMILKSCLAGILFSVSLTIYSAETARTASFETAVAPILEARCAKCHNPNTKKGELDLSTATGIVRGGESGPVFTAGDPKHSHLLELVEKGEMPKKGDPLSTVQIETIRNWIEAGAPFEKLPVPTEETLNQHDIYPIVHLRCVTCHGPQRKDGGLDLRNRSAMVKGGKNGPALVLGNPEASPMIQRIENQSCPPQHLLLKFFVRRPPPSEVKTLRQWIADGAPEKDISPDVATTHPDPLLTDEDRQHWAFLPPRRNPDIDPKNLNVDFFVERKLKAAGLCFSPQANRDTLIRRAYFDLIGLPPAVAEWEKWRSSNEPDWYEKMIDHLLASPHYGERWGRYWLDLAGYADSEGGISADPIRSVAWKYRDYVIDAFNADKPYDRFLLEQLAGDELIDHTRAPEITSEMVDNLVATGFLRMGMDQTGSRTMNFVPERIGVIADAISVVGSGLMGLTLECVRCHSHKYDPIPHRDYYRLKAVFQGAYDEHDWLTFKNRTLQVATPDHKTRYKKVNPPLVAQEKKLEALRKKKITEWQRQLLKHHFPDQSERDREATFPALRIADNTRTQTQRLLVEKLQIALAFPHSDQPAAVKKARAAVEEIERQLDVVRAKKVPPLAIRALWDQGRPSPTYIFRRGEHSKPGRLVGPGIPSVLTDGKTPFQVDPPFPGGTPKTGRRLAFAKWLTRPDHPLTARVMVNRIWYHHFGTGLVRTLENFGVQGEKPSHPELLDWLAIELVDRGWSIKEMHRLIMNSRTYRQSSRVRSQQIERDPRNRLLSRMPLRRLDAEALRDSMLFVSGKLDPTPGGPPDGIIAEQDGLVLAKATLSGKWRRSIYIQYRRTEIPTMMDTFDYPVMGPNCLERPVSTVSPQALMLMNNKRVREFAAAIAEKIEAAGHRDFQSQVKAAYHRTLSRPPDAEELKLGVEALTELQQEWPENETGALESYCHTLINSAAFLYVD